MRTDSNVERISFRRSNRWRTDPFEDVHVPEIDRRLEGVETVDGQLMVHSLSGHERNHLFLNQQGKQFADVSLVSGVDTPADSRGFVLFDYDRDGWQDIALVNANAPLLNLYRNQIGDIADKPAGQYIALRLIGGNETSAASSLACRDGYGAIVEVGIGDAVLKREHRCGEGYGSQNSNTMLVGIGERDQVDFVRVRWPSQQTQQIEGVAAGSLVTVRERADQSAGQAEFDIQTYANSQKSALAGLAPSYDIMQLGPLQTLDGEEPEPAEMTLYVTMATWCVACVEHMPHLKHLQDSLPSGSIKMIGLPIDPEDTPEKLTQFANEFQPVYAQVLQLSESQRSQVGAALAGVIPFDATPSSIVVDRDGRILSATAGVPTVSDLRRLRGQLLEPKP